MTRKNPDLYQQGFDIIRPDLCDVKKTLRNQNLDLVHYTSAEAAINIIRKKEIWMRKSSLMNDFSEVEYGIKNIIDGYNSPQIQNKFERFFQAISSDSKENFEKEFNSSLNLMRYETYVLSLGEHCTSEDNLGRLSMWRAYGNKTGVALVINPEHIENEAATARAMALPVLYQSEDEFLKFLENLIDRCLSKVSFFTNAGPEATHGLMKLNFMYLAMTLKHKGFEEEKEWRFIANPSAFGGDGLIPEVQTINSTPQKILKLPLDRYHETKSVEFTLDELLKRIIVGPSDFGYEVADALAMELRLAGVSNPGKRIHNSHIPLRC